MIITKKFSFESAHRLLNLPVGHKCRKLHGHSYEMTLIIKGTPSAETGFILDYAEVSKLGNDIADDLDHSVLVASPDVHLLRTALDLDSKVVVFPQSNTSCEFMAKTLLVCLARGLSNLPNAEQVLHPTKGSVEDISITLSETRKTICKASLSDMGYQNIIDFLRDRAGNKYTYMVVYPTEGEGQRSLKVIDKNDSLERIRAFIKAYDSESPQDEKRNAQESQDDWEEEIEEKESKGSAEDILSVLRRMTEEDRSQVDSARFVLNNVRDILVAVLDGVNSGVITSVNAIPVNLLSSCDNDCVHCDELCPMRRSVPTSSILTSMYRQAMSERGVRPFTGLLSFNKKLFELNFRYAQDLSSGLRGGMSPQEKHDLSIHHDVIQFLSEHILTPVSKFGRDK